MPRLVEREKPHQPTLDELSNLVERYPERAKIITIYDPTVIDRATRRILTEWGWRIIAENSS